MSDEWRDRFEDLKEAYALGALPEDERVWFEGYLAEHPELQAEVDELVSVANLLALAPQEHEPSPELRRNLLSSIEGATGAAPAERTPLGERLRGLFGPGGIAAAAAAIAAVAVVAVVGLFAWNVSLRGENEDLRGDLQTRRTHELVGSGAARDVRGEVIEVGAEGRAVLVAENLPSVPEEQVYEAWLMRGEDAEPAGLFEPREEGTAAMPLEGSLDGADAVAVTVEPSGGSSSPTSDPLVTANI